MKFCQLCGRRMKKNTLSTNVMFRCYCGQYIAGNAEDTLFAERRLGGSESIIKYDQFIKNSAYDPAGLKVEGKCICGLDFLTMIRYGPQEQILFTCTCGYRGSTPTPIETAK